MRLEMVASSVCLAAALCAPAVAPAQENPAADAQRRLQLSNDQLLALYAEAAATHNGFAYTLDFARLPDCGEAQKLLAQLDTPPYRLRALRQATKTFRYTSRFLFAMEPELREQVRAMSERDRTGAVKLANGECLVAEVIEYKERPMLKLEELGPQLALIVDRGWLPHPDQLEKDPKLRSRTAANRIRSAADAEGASAGFDFNTRRSDGYTILTRALLLNDAGLARAALKRGADPNVCGPRFCPLNLALGMRDPLQASEMLDLLLQARADPNQFDRAQRTRLLPLATAASEDLGFVERLVKAGAKANGIPEASPPLFFAAAAGRRDVVDYLIARGADVFTRDASRPGRNTAYTAAQVSKNPAFVDWMEKRMLEIAEKSGKYRCDVWLEQDGRRVPAKGDEFRLKRAPFRVFVRLPDAGSGILVASSQATAFQEDVRLKRMESAVFRPGTAGAEENEGKSDWLLVLSTADSTSTGTTQYWYWENDSNRRFTGRGGGPAEYYKEIRTVLVPKGNPNADPVPIAKFDGRDIYLVAAVPVDLSNFDQRFVDPHFLRLKFE